MKKTFTLIDPKHAPARRVEAVKHEIKKYVARERRKSLPEGFDAWKFDCRFGKDESSAQMIHLNEVGKSIDQLFQNGTMNFYVEILSKPSIRAAKPTKEQS
jgi:hypothetical protein